MPTHVKTSKRTSATWTVLAQLFSDNIVAPCKNWLGNWRHAAVQWFASFARDVAKELKPAVDEAGALFRDFGKPIYSALEGAFADLAKGAIDTVIGNLEKHRDVTPDQASAIAGEAMADAFSFGLASFGTSAAFEMLLPEKLNTLNGVGPMLATLAGFEEVTKQTLGPALHAGIGIPAAYDANSKFRSNLPQAMAALIMYSRRLITRAQLDELLSFAGLAKQWVDPTAESAYRAIQPRALAQAYEDVPFPRDQVQSILEYGGLRPVDIPVLLDALEAGSTKNVRHQYLAAVEQAAMRGALTDAELDGHLDSMGFSDQAKNFVHSTVAVHKLQQLEELYRQANSEAYRYGLVSDAEYIPNLTNIGIAEPDANAHYGIDSTKKQGRAIVQAEHDQARLDRERKSAAIAAANEQYAKEIINGVGLAAAYALAGVDPPTAASLVQLQAARLQARKRDVFGVMVTPDKAVLLKEKVAALKEQALKKIGTPDAWLAELKAQGIPDANAQALVAEWAAQALKLVLPV